MSQLEQLQLIVDSLCFGKKSELQHRLRMPNGSTITGWFQRGNFDIRRIATAFPELSIDWLVFGNGPMLKADCRKEAFIGDSNDDINPNETTPTHDGARPYPEQPSSDAQIYKVAEGESVDRALLNMLLHEKATMMQELAVLRQRNLELEKQNAVMSDRLENAEHWYRTNIQNKKG